ncbi:hypothetical protein MNV49_007034 [Pseudohyphozyma bogoriensis]|nr:hypothetical protein MNV49_007034 [Pseudohyphozyma bogoriensis]
MLFRTTLTAIVVASQLAFGVPTDELEEYSLVKRATTLGDGKSFKFGSVNSKFRWQASGILARGGCNAKYLIKDCYSSYLASTGMLESTTSANSKRESLSLEDAAAADDEDLEVYQDFLDSTISNPEAGDAETSDTLSKRQVIGCGGGGTPTTSTSAGPTPTPAPPRPVITLDAKAGMAVIGDTVRGCTSCASVPLAQFVGKTIVHKVTIKYGLSGTFMYSAVDIKNPGKTLLAYRAKGDMGANASLKFGMYRAAIAGMSEARSFLGDYSARKL